MYVLTHEQVGGEEDDCPTRDIVAVHTDIIILSAMVPTGGFQVVDPEWFDDHPSWGDYNLIERYVIARFDDATGLPDKAPPTIFWSLKDLDLEAD